MLACKAKKKIVSQKKWLKWSELINNNNNNNKNHKQKKQLKIRSVNHRFFLIHTKINPFRYLCLMILCGHHHCHHHHYRYEIRYSKKKNLWSSNHTMLYVIFVLDKKNRFVILHRHCIWNYRFYDHNHHQYKMVAIIIDNHQIFLHLNTKTTVISSTSLDNNNNNKKLWRK